MMSFEVIRLEKVYWNGWVISAILDLKLNNLHVYQRSRTNQIRTLTKLDIMAD